MQEPDKLDNYSTQSSGPNESEQKCPIPTNFTIYGDSSGQVFGNYYCLTTTTSNTVNTQWVGFNFYTSTNYGTQQQPTHNIIVPFFKQVLHGWGAFFGNNSQSSDGCGANMTFTTQIEGRAQTGLPTVPQSQDWQSKTYNGPNSCGAELQPYHSYHMDIQANNNTWVAYQVQEYQNGNLVTVTPWKQLQVLVPGQKWNPPILAPNLDFSAKGLFIGSVPGGSNWTIYISNFSYGWF
ncbi:hypothetical protein [Candidatus Nitrosacidococcus sp. I8]|uniref:hypothetical protein n=1 Tax=Candidatus Nitrosacidococcus sp. I8 TaxID=2942908 RepID=UPI002226C1E7|nr:hypothetical protein [Candidatus Nitrosacidococcus sp. I8]CAH9017026.1 hypothetical protein NURINAE_00282 [Candidatus Nitrosacidococcus sp. I8]